MTRAALLLAFALACSSTPEALESQRLSPFTTDGCSLFPDGSWAHCCLAHDLAYWRGGGRLQRLERDDRLEGCVSGTGHPAIASLMYLGVRLGGSPWLPAPFRWGYGWPYGRGYQLPTPNEQRQIEVEEPGR